MSKNGVSRPKPTRRISFILTARYSKEAEDERNTEGEVPKVSL